MDPVSQVSSSPSELISLPFCFHILLLSVKCFPHNTSVRNRQSDTHPSALPSEREEYGKRPHLRGRAVATLVDSIRLWWLVERKGCPKDVGRRVLKTHSIVLGSTLNAQNCTKHIRRETNYTWELKLKTELIQVPLKWPSSLGTLSGEKHLKQNETGHQTHSACPGFSQSVKALALPTRTPVEIPLGSLPGWLLKCSWI